MAAASSMPKGTSPTCELCIAGGGTGGHVLPALALADAVRGQWKHVGVSFIGAERGLEARLLPERGESVLLLSMHAVQGSSLWQKVWVLCWELPKAVLKIRKLWAKKKPQVLVGVGGYASVAGVLAALISRVPVVLYEQNAVPGLVNRQLFRFCATMMLGFEAAAAHFAASGQHKLVVTGNMIRQDILNTNYHHQEPPCLLIMGGSQGAMFLNDTVPKACAALAGEGNVISVIHLVGAGESRVEAVLQQYQQAGIAADVRCFADDMPALYAKVDLLIARAGAMSVSEAAAVGLPALFVPLPSAADQHQYFNAKALADVGAAEIIMQHDCSIAQLQQILRSTLLCKAKLQQMSQAAKAALTHDARVAQIEVLRMYLSEVKA